MIQWYWVIIAFFIGAFALAVFIIWVTDDEWNRSSEDANEKYKRFKKNNRNDHRN